MLVHGGHGFKVLEPVKMLEIKQGPYVSDKDKVKFDKIDEKKIKIQKNFNFIPVNKPLVTREDINYLNKSISKGWISSEGPQVKKFEKNFSKFHR